MNWTQVFVQVVFYFQEEGNGGLRAKSKLINFLKHLKSSLSGSSQLVLDTFLQSCLKKATAQPSFSLPSSSLPLSGGCPGFASGTDGESGVNIYTWSCVKQIAAEELLGHTGSPAWPLRWLRWVRWGRGTGWPERGCTCDYRSFTLLYSRTNTLESNFPPIQKKKENV